jgi:hypothetical protein
MRRLLKEPLVHFLALGAVLFVIGIVRGEGSGLGTNRIAITPGAIERLVEGFGKTWQRPPTEAEFQGLVEDYLKEEVLYREALEMGLDRDDQIIRRRMRQKLEFLTSDVVESFEPTDEELQAHLDANVALYRQEATVSFLQAYIAERTDPEQDGARAMALLEELRRNPNIDPEQMGDPFMYPAAHGNMREQAVLGLFGEEFTAQIAELPIGEWSGPVTSAFGLHIVRVDMRDPGRTSELAEVRDAVRRDLVSQRTREADQSYFDGLLAQYTVTVEWPEGMQPVDLPGVAR